MKVIRMSCHLKDQERDCVVTIGNFDGFHLGHQALIKKLISQGAELQLPTCVILFEPQPNEFFSKEPLPRLMRFREKVEILKENGIDRVLCIAFNQQVASQKAEDFVSKILVDKLGAKYVLVGDDFHFGYQRRGDFALLQALGRYYHFQAESMATFEWLGERVSSTRIRELLQNGDVETAGRLLGRPFGMKGTIIHGKKMGRLIGSPTANINLYRKYLPLRGVFAVEVLGLKALPLPGVANVGTRPSLQGTQALLEVHLLDFNQEIYGKKVEVRFLQKFRDEKKFDSLEALKQQIQLDIKQARTYHQTHDNTSS